ncbi:MAG: hypothetical protein ACK55J_04695 [Alphaproteobacteria bacterium]
MSKLGQTRINRRRAGIKTAFLIAPRDLGKDLGDEGILIGAWAQTAPLNIKSGIHYGLNFPLGLLKISRYFRIQACGQAEDEAFSQALRLDARKNAALGKCGHECLHIVLRAWQLIHLCLKPRLRCFNPRNGILQIRKPANEKCMACIVLVLQCLAQKNDEIAEPAMAAFALEAGFEVGWKLLVLQGRTQFLPHIFFGSFAVLRSARCISRIGLRCQGGIQACLVSGDAFPMRAILHLAKGEKLAMHPFARGWAEGVSRFAAFHSAFGFLETILLKDQMKAGQKRGEAQAAFQIMILGCFDIGLGVLFGLVQ